jgi:molecular chaperone GrpE
MPLDNDTLSRDEVNDTEKVAESAEVEHKALQAADILLLQKTLAEETAKAEKYLANWQRAQADYANCKRRSEQEKEDVKQYGNSILIMSLLPVLDDMERAMDSVPAKMGHQTWLNGVKLILRKFQAVLEAQGLSQIKAVGQQFDPEFHEAVMGAPGKEGVVIEELQKGYKLKDRVIRPSKVVVGQGKEQKEQKEISEDKQQSSDFGGK